MSNMDFSEVIKNASYIYARLGIADPRGLEVHVVAEDPRYPTICVNGRLNFGLPYDPESHTIPDWKPVCICAARYDNECICDLDPEDYNDYGCIGSM